jgi:DNA-directed RNA polymerase subunit RPC12/RpoP
MSQIRTIECEECEGRCVVKIPTNMEENYSVVACPLCGAPVESHDDLDDHE